MVTLDELLGLVYVSVWSVSMYPPLLVNYRQRSTKAISVDFAILNTAGYTYLMISMALQLYFWIEVAKDVDRPKVTQFDMWYCAHGFLLNLVLLSQIVFGRKLWNFYRDNKLRRMKQGYYRILWVSIVIFLLLTGQFVLNNMQQNWDNSRTLNYCNNLFLLKISMSLIKYIPQVKHNYDRRSVKGFAIQGVILDVTGGVASLLQLLVQLSRDQGFSLATFLTNFGKIGIALVTLIFNFIFISQWLLYK
ncbi:similar to Saccharomyces cerevisiae YCR075C ERS1 Protein with similarity to human cystinosin [Maudiozyma saulgeensis]|uniref:Similar to Saccharomyces cerevisiae YCR075C ERS1 Protein with similarity to human cystinosin n=1 Tax=Maudiozyma saulgeensis TaxID=1789683 RepID=A0A1X7R4Z2_9SACH|nr:similar to Saccharomyces cerevisiae YCR075C ERS1 Protein with similarity to human cystinosin [Kazachstania saulgeensis]